MAVKEVPGLSRRTTLCGGGSRDLLHPGLSVCAATRSLRNRPFFGTFSVWLPVHGAALPGSARLRMGKACPPGSLPIGRASAFSAFQGGVKLRYLCWQITFLRICVLSLPLLPACQRLVQCNSSKLQIILRSVYIDDGLGRVCFQQGRLPLVFSNHRLGSRFDWGLEHFSEQFSSE